MKIKFDMGATTFEMHPSFEMDVTPDEIKTIIASDVVQSAIHHIGSEKAGKIAEKFFGGMKSKCHGPEKACKCRNTEKYTTSKSDGNEQPTEHTEETSSTSDNDFIGITSEFDEYNLEEAAKCCDTKLLHRLCEEYSELANLNNSLIMMMNGQLDYSPNRIISTTARIKKIYASIKDTMAAIEKAKKEKDEDESCIMMDELDCIIETCKEDLEPYIKGELPLNIDNVFAIVDNARLRYTASKDEQSN